MDATNATDHDLDRGVLPGQQAVARCKNSVSWFILYSFQIRADIVRYERAT